MSKMKLETLTPLHIGSGNVLQKDCDFVCGNNAEGKPIVGIIDPRKVLALIGEENIDAWTVAIENGRGTDDMVRQYAPKAEIADYTRHLIDSYMPQSREPQQIKEFIRDGLGRPYIPGSSIKGAIRTAVLADIAAKMQEAELLQKPGGKGRITAKSLEANVFGKDPKCDVFRYVLVGDAVAKGYCTAVCNMVNINERVEKVFWDTSKPMATEVLLCGAEVEFSLTLKQPLLRPKDMPSSPQALCSVDKLLETVNSHTKALLADEIKKWRAKDVDAPSEKKVEDYISQLEKLRETADECQGTRSAVMRMGHGSGRRFITGAWAERLLPKSRRLEEEECEPLGFVKLTLIE